MVSEVGASQILEVSKPRELLVGGRERREKRPHLETALELLVGRHGPVRGREGLVHQDLVGAPGSHAHGLVVGDPAQPAVRLVRPPAAVAVPPGTEDRLLGGLVGGLGGPHDPQCLAEAEAS